MLVASAKRGAVGGVLLENPFCETELSKEASEHGEAHHRRAFARQAQHVGIEFGAGRSDRVDMGGTRKQRGDVVNIGWIGVVSEGALVLA